MAEQTAHTWDLWIPDAGSRGISFARGRMRATDVALVHAAPEKLKVEVWDDEGQRIAQAGSLARTRDTPMARLTMRDGTLTREDFWPTERDYGTPVILAGGEIGILKQWWNAQDETQWRWQLEFYNHR